MRPEHNWRTVRVKRRREGLLVELARDLLKLIFSLPVAYALFAFVWVIHLADQPHSPIPALYRHTLQSYAQTYKTTVARLVASEPVITSLNCEQGGNAFPGKNVHYSACTAVTVEPAKTSAGTYVRAWVTNAGLAGQSVAVAAKRYCERYLWCNRNNW